MLLTGVCTPPICADLMDMGIANCVQSFFRGATMRFGVLIQAFLALHCATLSAQPDLHLGPVVGRFPLRTRVFPSLRELADGRVLVVDTVGRLVLTDPQLNLIRVLVDTVPYAARSTRAGTGPFITELTGDSSLYLDGVDLSYSVVTPEGIARRSVFPKPSDATYMRRTSGLPAVDNRGRMVYPGLIRGDSIGLLGISLTLRTVDTIAILGIQGHVDRSGSVVKNRPVSFDDLWAVLDDGSVAVVRSHDLTIERFPSAGRGSSVVRVPYQAIALDSVERARILDSARTATMAAATQPAAASRRGTTVVMEFVQLQDMPSELPAIMSSSAIAAPNGRLWVAETKRYRGNDSISYLVIDVRRAGSPLVGRVNIPPNTYILRVGKDYIFLWRPSVGIEKIALRTG